MDDQHHSARRLETERLVISRYAPETVGAGILVFERLLESIPRHRFKCHLRSVTFVVANVARQGFILASLSLSIAQSLSIARGTNGAIVLGHGLADFDIIVTTAAQIFVLLLVTLPWTVLVLCSTGAVT